MFTILKERMKEYGDLTAIVSFNQEYRYHELLKNVLEKEQVFKNNGLTKSDVVVLVGDFSFESTAALIALFSLGVTVLPMTKDSNTKLEKYIEKMDPDFFIQTIPEFRITRLKTLGTASEWRKTIPKNSAGLVVFTSGSTGVPKAIIHDVNQLCYRYQEKKNPLISICFLLFDHMGGINTLLSLLFRGATAVNVNDRSVETVCNAIEKYRVQLLPTTPSFLSQLLLSRSYQNYDLSSLLVVSYGTEVMSESVLKKLNDVFPHCAFKQTYGLSETGVLQIKSKSKDNLWFKFIDDGVETKIRDNVLWIKTKSNLLGKILFTEESLVLDKTTEEWFCTNDLVEVDGEYIQILGRQTDIINVGGLKVYPSEVENCIHKLDFVDDVFVKGKKHPLIGQIVVAHILLNESITKGDAEKIIKRHCIENLERFKIPSQFIFKWENFVNDRFKKVRTT